jgi:hypothetical protein
VGQHRAGPVDVAEEVGLQHLPEGLGWGCLQQAEQVDTGVVDQMSIRPNRSTARRASSVTAASSVMSVDTARAWPPAAWHCRASSSRASARRAANITRAPRSANASPVARPIPLEAPVTTTTAPLSFLLMLNTRLLS